MTNTATTKQPITLISWNVNGIRAAYKKGFLDWLATTQPDILCLQETKIHAHQLTEEMKQPPSGYHAFYSHAERAGYSGTAIWSKEKPIRVETGFGFPEFDSEGRTVVAEFEHFILYGTYYPNGGNATKDRLTYKHGFYDAFLTQHLQPLVAVGKPIILTGDFNTAHYPIDLARPKENEKKSGFMPEERAWLDKLVAMGFVDTFRAIHPDEAERYSWWDMQTRARDRNVGWRIDYFFATQNLMPFVVDADIHDQTLGSDHAPCVLKLAF
jgi:exodeoxyribonuclease-3